jgi:hypothetical protein
MFGSEAIKNGQSRETGHIGYTRRRQTKRKHITICVGQHYMQINTYNVNTTWILFNYIAIIRHIRFQEYNLVTY